MTEPIQDAVEWRKAHPAFIAIQFLRNVRGLIVPIVLVLVSRGIQGTLAQGSWFLWIGLVGAIVLAGFSFVSWQFFRYGISDRQIQVRSGFINKQERSVSFERIQAVDIEEAPLDRMFGVVRVRVETAAGGASAQSDVRIEALKRNDAEALRSFLIRARQDARGDREQQTIDASESESPTTSIDVLAEGVLVRAISTRELLVAGATSGRVGPAAAIVGFFTQFADDVVPQSWWERLPWDNVADIVSSIQALALAALVIGSIAWILSTVSTILSLGGFEIRKTEDQLIIRYGLLDRQRLTIPIQRMQAIRVIEGVLRQPFGMAEVRFESAGFNTESAANGVLFPLLRRSEITGFLEDVAPEFAADASATRLQSLPPRAVSRYVIPQAVSLLVLSIGLIVLVRLITGSIETWSLLSLILVPITALYGLLEYKDTGWLIEGGNLIVRRRTGGRETLITRTRRLQLRAVQSNPFQRRANLVTFRAAVASGGSGGRFEIAHIDRAEGNRLLAVLAPQSRRTDRASTTQRISSISQPPSV